MTLWIIFIFTLVWLKPLCIFIITVKKKCFCWYVFYFSNKIETICICVHNLVLFSRNYSYHTTYTNHIDQKHFVDKSDILSVFGNPVLKISNALIKTCCFQKSFSDKFKHFEQINIYPKSFKLALLCGKVTKLCFLK